EEKEERKRKEKIKKEKERIEKERLDKEKAEREKQEKEAKEQGIRNPVARPVSKGGTKVESTRNLNKTKEEIEEEERIKQEKEEEERKIKQQNQRGAYSLPGLTIKRTIPAFSLVLNVPKSLMMLTFGLRIFSRRDDLLYLNPTLMSPYIAQQIKVLKLLEEQIKDDSNNTSPANSKPNTPNTTLSATHVSLLSRTKKSQKPPKLTSLTVWPHTTWKPEVLDLFTPELAEQLTKTTALFKPFFPSLRIITMSDSSEDTANAAGVPEVKLSDIDG
ncbi:MAG: hypothetical protein EZS28_053033, partial [Streblomastix strix]